MDCRLAKFWVRALDRSGESDFGWALSRLSTTWKWNQVERGSCNTLLRPASAEVRYYRALRPHALRALHNYFYCACALIVSAQVVHSAGAGMRTSLRNSAKCIRLLLWHTTTNWRMSGMYERVCHCGIHITISVSLRLLPYMLFLSTAITRSSLSY